MKSFFDRIPDMECLRGDTLGNFVISAESDDFTNCRMQVIIAKRESSAIALICKECEFSDGEFHVLITSDDTAKLSEGTYIIHFRLIDGSGLSYRKLVGNLYVYQAAQGGD
ncbi:MAG: hypothetical protein K2K91_02070 [Ruminococcus sp.]|nr:hypothetical protein [Ruminococcus sp.]